MANKYGLLLLLRPRKIVPSVLTMRTYISCNKLYFSNAHHYCSSVITTLCKYENKVFGRSRLELTSLSVVRFNHWGEQFFISSDIACRVSDAYATFVQGKESEEDIKWEKVTTFFESSLVGKTWPVPFLAYIGEKMSCSKLDLNSSLLHYIKQNDHLKSVLETELFWLVYAFSLSTQRDQQDKVLSLITGKDVKQMRHISSVLVAKIYNNIESNSWKDIYMLPNIKRHAHIFFNRALEEREFDHVINIANFSDTKQPSLLPGSLSKYDTFSLLIKQAVACPEFMLKVFGLLKEKHWYLYENQALDLCKHILRYVNLAENCYRVSV